MMMYYYYIKIRFWPYIMFVYIIFRTSLLN